MKLNPDNAPKDQPPAAIYDDGNIPSVDLPGGQNVEPLPEAERPRKDGPGGE